MSHGDKAFDPVNISEEEFLKTYDAGEYERPSVTVDMLVFTIRSGEQENYRKLAEPELGLLLIRRGGHPYLGQWALPGGFVSMDESLEDLCPSGIAYGDRTGRYLSGTAVYMGRCRPRSAHTGH